jgi:hypothetical protein
MPVHAIRTMQLPDILAATVFGIYSPPVHRRNATLRYYFALLLSGVFLVSCRADQASNPGSDDTELRQAQASRIQAMIEADDEALNALLADELSYAHSTGQLDTKETFIGALKSGIVRYRSIDPRESNVRVYDDIGIITGIAAVNVTAGDQDHSAVLRTTEVYQRDVQGWLLIAYQSTRVPQ